MGIKVTGTDKAIKQLEAQSKAINKGLDDAFNKFGTRVVADAKRVVPVDESLLINSIGYTKKDNGVEIVASAEYAAFVEFGTRKFAAQYVATLPQDWQTYAAKFKGKGSGTFNDLLKSIMGWVKRHGMKDSAAYPIALKIMREGVKPRKFFFTAVQNNEDKLSEDIRKLFK